MGGSSSSAPKPPPVNFVYQTTYVSRPGETALPPPSAGHPETVPFVQTMMQRFQPPPATLPPSQPATASPAVSSYPAAAAYPQYPQQPQMYQPNPYQGHPGYAQPPVYQTPPMWVTLSVYLFLCVSNVLLIIFAGMLNLAICLSNSSNTQEWFTRRLVA